MRQKIKVIMLAVSAVVIVAILAGVLLHQFRIDQARQEALAAKQQEYAVKAREAALKHERERAEREKRVSKLCSTERQEQMQKHIAKQRKAVQKANIEALEKGAGVYLYCAGKQLQEAEKHYQERKFYKERSEEFIDYAHMDIDDGDYGEAETDYEYANDDQRLSEEAFHEAVGAETRAYMSAKRGLEFVDNLEKAKKNAIE